MGGGSHDPPDLSLSICESPVPTYLSFLKWLILFNMMIFQFHSFSCKQHDFIFLSGQIIFHCIYLPTFLDPLIDGHLGWFLNLALVSNITINLNMQVSLLYADFWFLWVYTQKWYSWIIWQMYFQFFEEPPYWLRIRVITLISHQQCVKGSFPSTLALWILANFCSFCFLMIGILTGVRWNHNVALKGWGVWHRVLLCSPVWPWTMILLLQPPKFWDYRHALPRKLQHSFDLHFPDG
jgi:hypothetical protein